MRTIKFLLIKEFKQIFRNRILLGAMFVAPLLQLIVLPFAANYEIKNISIAVVDHDHSTYSRNLIESIRGNGYFILTGCFDSYHEGYRMIESDEADMVLEIPAGFEQRLIRENQQKVFIAVNAINGVKAIMGNAYLMNILKTYSASIRSEWLPVEKFPSSSSIEIRSANWFNPLMNYRMYMVPGILTFLVTIIAGFMCSLNIVREKEIGTIEQINVTPIKKYQFILGKLIPFWIIGMVIFSVGLLVIARFVYGIIPLGSYGLMYAYLSIYLFGILGFGLLVSTYSETQQQAMSIAFFFVMIFNLMGGLFTSVESMPQWAQIIARINPLTYFIEVMRMVVLKGSGFFDLKIHFLAALIFAVTMNTWAILHYKKTS